MRLLFVLPAPVRVPMGGAAVVYRHAEGLAGLGHEVTVAAPQRAEGLAGRAVRAAVRARDWRQRVAGVPHYDAPGVTTLEPLTWRGLDGTLYDAVIATGHQTAPWVSSIRESTGCPGVYFIQGDERALSPRAGETWHLPLRRIVVSEWLADVLRGESLSVAGVVPNAVDPARFAVDTSPAERRPEVVALYHRHPVKGPATLLGALESLRRRMPEAGATVIAARPPSHRLPDWVRVEVRPRPERLRALYNAAAVCLHTSRVEGWGLVPMEAAACGCAVVATASRGPREFLTPGASMLEVPVGDAEAVAREAETLLRDADLRARVAAAGLRDVTRFRWGDATRRFEALLAGE